jgi:hypothetical protein
MREIAVRSGAEVLCLTLIYCLGEVRARVATGSRAHPSDLCVVNHPLRTNPFTMTLFLQQKKEPCNGGNHVFWGRKFPRAFRTPWKACRGRS